MFLHSTRAVNIGADLASVKKKIAITFCKNLPKRHEETPDKTMSEMKKKKLKKLLKFGTYKSKFGSVSLNWDANSISSVGRGANFSSGEHNPPFRSKSA